MRRRFHRVWHGDALEVMRALPSASVRCCVTSPPYWGLRDYGDPRQIGHEGTPEEYVGKLVGVFRELRRVLADDGTFWLNLGDSFSHGGCGSRDPERWPKQSRNDHMRRHAKKMTGLRPKELIGVPWMAAFALREDGWHLRTDLVWAKANPMVESVRDRPTRAHEFVFLFSKNGRYHYDADAVKEKATGKAPGNVSRHKYADLSSLSDSSRRRMQDLVKNTRSGYEFRNRRSVWFLSNRPFRGAHFATFPPALVEPMVLAGSQPGDVVLDPFSGAATVGLVAARHGRRFWGIDVNAEYVKMGLERIAEGRR